MTLQRYNKNHQTWQTCLCFFFLRSYDGVFISKRQTRMCFLITHLLRYGFSVSVSLRCDGDVKRDAPWRSVPL